MAKISNRDTYTLDPQLAADTLAAGVLDLCAVRVMNDRRFPWLVLVPRMAEASEIFQLPAAAQASLMNEISLVSQVLKTTTGCDKINLAAFGNMVPQLHIHVIARFKGDPAWPASAIGYAGKEPYGQSVAEKFIEKLCRLLPT